MALTGRDIMFTLRAQDMASRQVRGLAGSFGALDRQLRTVNRRMSSDLSAATRKNADDMNRLANQGKRVNQGYKDQIATTKQFRDQGLNKTTDAYKRQTKAIKDYENSLKPAKQERIAAAQRAGAASINMANKAYERQQAIRSSKINDTMFKRDERLASIKESQAKAIGQVKSQYQGVANQLGQNNDRLRTLNARITEQIRLNSSLTASDKRQLADARTRAKTQMAMNTERINAVRRAAAMEQQAIRANAKADETATKRESARRVETIKHAQTTAQAKHNAHIAHLRGIEAAEVRAAKADYDRGRQRVAQAKTHAAAVRDSEQQGLRRAADARVAALQQEQAQYNQRLNMTKAAVKQRFQIERAHVQALAEYQERELMRRQVRVQRAMMGGAALSMLGGILGGVAAKGISSLSAMTEEAKEFNNTIALAMTQVDGFQTSVGELGDVVLRVAREVPTAMEEMPDVLYDIFSSMDVGLESAENLLRGFSQEAVAGNAKVRDSARSTMAILNGMGLVSEDVAQMQENLTRVQDFQFQTVRKGVITYQELSTNIGKLIPALRRTNQEIEQGGAMMSFLTRNGLSAEMAATAAARALELIGDPRVVSRMEEMGITVRDAGGDFIALDKILKQLAERMGSLPAPERAQAMLDLFGGAGYRIQARRFFDVVLPAFDEYNKHVGWARDNTGAFERALNTMLETPQARAQQLENNVKALRVEFGEQLFPILMRLIDMGMKALEWVKDLNDSMGGSLPIVLAYASAISAVAGAVTLAVGLFLSLGSLLAMATGKGVIFSTLMAGGVLTGVMAVTAALAYLVLNFDSLGEIVDTVSDYFSDGEGKIRLFIAAMVALTTVGWLWVAAGGSMAAVTTGVSLGFLAMRTGAVKAAAAMGTLLATHPLLIAFTAATAAVLLIYRDFTKPTREMADAVAAQGDALKDVGDTIMGSMDGFNRRNELMDEAARKTAYASLEEKGLMDAMQSVTALRQGVYGDAILGTNADREAAIEAINAEKAAIEDQLTTMERFVRWTDKFSWFESGYGDLERVNELRTLTEEIDRQAEAIKRAREAELLRMETQSEAGAIIADFIRMEEGLIPSTFLTRNAQLEMVKALLETSDAFKALDPETQAQIMSNNDLAAAAGRAGEEYLELQGVAASLLDVLGQMTSPTAAWQDALNKLTEANNALEEPLDNVKVGMHDWIDAMEEANTKTTDMFGNMRDLWTKNTDATREDVNQTIAAVLAMGDSGPEAMELLAQADPKDFLEVLRNIQLNAALTGENVKAHMSDMVLGMETITDQYAEVNDKQFNDIFESTALAADLHGEAMLGLTDDMMVAIAGAIQAGHDPTVEEMALIANALVETGEDGAAGLIEALANGTGGIEAIVRDYAYAIKRGVDPILLQLGRREISIAGGRGGLKNRGYSKDDGYGYEGYNAGGRVLGRGPNRDSVEALLTPGEFVLRRQAVDNLDLHALHELNRTGDINTLVRKYNKGGFVTTGDVPRPPSMAPYQYPITAPATAYSENLHEQAKKFVYENAAPPLGAGIGWQKMWAAVSKRFPNAQLFSAYRPGAITATGNASYHGMGRAIDISPRMDIFNWLRQHYMSQMRELIFSPANSRQVHNGRNHMYSGVTRGNHWDHIHAAMAKGGMVSRPTNALIGEAGPELVIPLDKLGSVFRNAIGDGPGIGDNYTANFTGGVSGISGWAARAMPKYEKAMREATAENIESVRKMMGAVSAIRTHVEAQHNLANTHRNVERLRKEIIKLASDAEKAELALAQAWEESAKITAQEELNIISARQQVRKAEQDYASFHNGVYSLNQELSELQQEQRIAQMRQSLEELGNGDFGNIAELKDNLQAAKATLAGAQFEWARVQTILPTMTDEVEKLLLQFKTENSLADAQQAHTDAAKALQEAEKGNVESLHQRRIAEIELALAEQALTDLRSERLYTDEAARQAQLQLQLAQEALTQTEREAIGPTDEVRRAEEALREVREAQKQTAADLRQAHIDVSLAEFQAIEATLGMISAGQELNSLGSEQIRFFRELAAAAGMSADSINRTVSATRQLQSTSADIQKAIDTAGSFHDRGAIEEGFDSVYSRVREIFKNRRVTIATPTESERERLTRIAHEILSGSRTFDSVRSSVDRLARLGIGTYDRGGILPPGFTLAYNGTGQNEYVSRDKPDGGTTLVVEEGAFQLTVQGNMDSDVLPKVETMLGDFITDLESQFNRN